MPTVSTGPSVENQSGIGEHPEHALGFSTGLLQFCPRVGIRYDSGAGAKSPMVFAIAADGRPEFITGDSLGMLLVTGDINAIATVLESGELD